MKPASCTATTMALRNRATAIAPASTPVGARHAVPLLILRSLLQVSRDEQLKYSA
ncbi:hypothetical protein [Nostoc commune]|uniref:hypothetical protein n=1 Tax=Nostoc commune TaxID=1178 RepID=UPI0020746835|nr:hypothetical protein [Nostoc commune]